jgi:hypothetical protein
VSTVQTTCGAVFCMLTPYGKGTWGCQAGQRKARGVLGLRFAAAALVGGAAWEHLQLHMLSGGMPGDVGGILLGGVQQLHSSVTYELQLLVGRPMDRHHSPHSCCAEQGGAAAWPTTTR